MRKGFRNITLLAAAAVMVAMVAASCSTTKRIPDGETLYTGVGKFKINTPEGVKLPGELESELKSSINVKPNNPMPFMSPYVRWPIPLGLWVWNNWNDSVGGLRGWLYRKLASEPVLIADVKPDLRTAMMENQLTTQGYFRANTSYDIVYDKRNPKKARINYTVNTGRPSLIDSIYYLGVSDGMNRHEQRLNAFIDSVARQNPYLQKGERFSADSLEAVRVDIANRMRNRGYYYFRPEYIEFLADTVGTPGDVALKMTIAKGTPEMATRQFRTGKVTTILERRSARNPGTPDTLETGRGELIVMRPQRLRPNMIPSCITFRKGRLFSVRDMDRTQTRLSNLGIFGNITIQPMPADTADNPTLDVLITCKYDQPIEATLEVNATSKSNSYIGPGLAVGIRHHNLFGGAEKLTVQLTANYEWQTGRNRSSYFNSYEFGLKSSLAFPRLLAPSFIRRSRRDLSWTTISLGASTLNRPKYFQIAQFDMGINYDWQLSRRVSNSFTPLKLTYNKLIHHTEEFDEIMNENPAIRQSFMDQFIPQMSYTYTYDRWFERERINGITFTATASEAGNIFAGIWSLAGVKGEKKLFGTPFSQFVKGQAQLIYRRRLVKGSDQWLVTRVLVGAEHAYGNSTEVPYSEQFYIGGANSIRAFTVRSLGPGSFRSARSQVNGYFDQTGTFKFEMNAEYRFPIVSIIHGALFLDAGNIWLLKNDPLRPGGLLEAKTFWRDIALGTGVGLRVDMGAIVIRGDLGYGLHAPYDTGSSGYFNIRFKDAFAFHLAIGYPF